MAEIKYKPEGGKKEVMFSPREAASCELRAARRARSSLLAA